MELEEYEGDPVATVNQKKGQHEGCQGRGGGEGRGGDGECVYGQWMCELCVDGTVTHGHHTHTAFAVELWHSLTGTEEGLGKEEEEEEEEEEG